MIHKIKMKFRPQYRFLKWFVLIGIFSLITINLKSQSVSTIGEIYNFEIGDKFHFDNSYRWQNCDMCYINTIINIEILNRYSSQNSDTIFYIRDIAKQKRDYSSPDTDFWQYYYFTDTIYYYNLDSLINSGQIDTVYSNNNIYNGRIINYDYKFISDPIQIEQRTFVNGLGRVIFSENSVYWETFYYSQLVYYKKGNEEWGTEKVVFIDEINSVFPDNVLIYPNPFKNLINIKLNNIKEVSIKVFNTNGQMIYLEENIESSIHQIDLNGATGVYLIEVSSGHEKQEFKLLKK